MTRTLVLLRHGEAGHPAGVTDHERPLTAHGRSEAEAAGAQFDDDGLRIDAVICSTAQRTRQTLDGTGVDAPAVYTEEIYENTAEVILATIRTHAPADAGTVLVVGHFPGLPETVLLLDDDAVIEGFPTAGYAVLSIGTAWDRVGLDVDPQARLTALQIPR